MVIPQVILDRLNDGSAPALNGGTITIKNPEEANSSGNSTYDVRDTDEQGDETKYCVNGFPTYEEAKKYVDKLKGKFPNKASFGF